MSHTSSKTWVAPEMAERERFQTVVQNLERMNLIPKSPFVPRNMTEWVDHRVAFQAIMTAEEKEKLGNRQAELEANNGKKIKILPPFGGKHFKAGQSSVLALPTIWSPWSQPTEDHPEALWPSKDEMKEEGDERNTSGYGRFLALPRDPGNDTVVWKQKNIIKAFPIDVVWELPTAEEEIPPESDARMEDLVGEKLLRELDK
ncbi:hypothetical protein MMC12_003946 [Toensbergia leucococca]|nr:hypothetical protein [Toensbergia leucococca]